MEEPKQLDCPVCGEPMYYRPDQIWTGMRYNILFHSWECASSNEDRTESHYVKIKKKLDIDSVL